MISILDAVLWMSPAHLLLCYLLLHSRVGPLAQSLQGPNSNCYTSNYLKYSPNKHMFSYFEPALHTPWHCTQHLLALDKTNPGAIKDPRLLLHFRAPWLRDSHLGWKTSSRHHPSSPPEISCSLPLLSDGLTLPLEGFLLRGTSSFMQHYFMPPYEACQILSFCDFVFLSLISLQIFELISGYHTLCLSFGTFTLEKGSCLVMSSPVEESKWWET